MLRDMLRRKAIGPHHHAADSFLHQTLNAFDLTLMGIGAIIGAGVFVLTGVAAATKAGPAIIISYVLAGTASLFAALAYAELASSVGGTGSAYSYAYAGFGEFIAWLIGWNLILEYAMSAATVAIGWAGYVKNLFGAANINLPAVISKTPFEGGVINILATGIIFVLCGILILGVKQSARFNTVVVFIKLLTIAVFIGVAAFNVNPQNWHPFLPFGWNGVLEGAALVFFAYIGFDALSTAVEEAIEPQKNIPISIILSLLICTLIYIVVSILLTGIAPYQTLDVPSPVADALLHHGYSIGAGIIAAGAIAGLTTVMLVMFYGLTRICMAMARDGLMPKTLAKIHPQTRTPVRSIIITGLIIGLIAGFAPIDRAAELVNIGTLTAFAFVCGGVSVMRITHPDLHRPFKLPYDPLIPILGVLSCMYLMWQLPGVTWARFVIWTIVGLAIYFLYGMRHSVLGKAARNHAKNQIKVDRAPN